MADILIIDDDPQILRALAGLLEQQGHTVRQAGDGARALALLNEESADLVISDIYMPEMDGIEFLIRVHEEFPDLPIVAMSGGGFMPRDELLEDASQLGAVQILAKPFALADVLRVVENALGGSSP
ncbi:MAG TPA: response regulator [Longimicrobiales bacterium]|jgi:DNA-binding NtrC family response regulator